jgi:hypothetical protein
MLASLPHMANEHITAYHEEWTCDIVPSDAALPLRLQPTFQIRINISFPHKHCLLHYRMLTSVGIEVDKARRPYVQNLTKTVYA